MGKYLHRYTNRSQMFADWDDAMPVITTGFTGTDSQLGETGYCEYDNFNEFLGFVWDTSFAYGGGEGYTKVRNVTSGDSVIETFGTYGASVTTPDRVAGTGGPWVSYTEEPGTSTWNIKVKRAYLSHMTSIIQATTTKPCTITGNLETTGLSRGTSLGRNRHTSMRGPASMTSTVTRRERLCS